jgi:hypothetical protein
MSATYREVSLRQWYHPSTCHQQQQQQQQQHKKDAKENDKESRLPLPMIDLRSDEEYSKLSLLHCHSGTGTEAEVEAEAEGEAESKIERAEALTIVSLPFDQLQSGERSCELPPRHVEFAILLPASASISPSKLDDSVSSSSQSTSNDGTNDPNGDAKKTNPSAITSIDVNTILDFFFATKSQSTNQSRKPWLVREIIRESDGMWTEAKQLGLYQEKKREEIGNIVHSTMKPLPRLWKPDSMVERVLLPKLKAKLDELRTSVVASADGNKHSQNNAHRQYRRQSTFTIWDLGSGAGRDVCYLAEELKYFNCQRIRKRKRDRTESDKDRDSPEGDMSTVTAPAAATSVPMTDHSSTKNDQSMMKPASPSPFTPLIKLSLVGIDNHKGSARRCVPLWKYRNVQDITHSRLLDLKKLKTVWNEIRNDDSGDGDDNDGIACLYVIRFLNRNVVQYIAHDAPLKRGTMFAMSHFCKERDEVEWNFDHPKPHSVLNRRELRDVFLSSTDSGGGGGDGNVDSQGIQEGQEGQQHRWKILHDEICLDGDHGRTLINFIAERI